MPQIQVWGTLQSAPALLFPQSCNIKLTQCWSCPCKATNLPFLLTQSVGSSNEKLEPGTWSGAASGCHFHRARILNKPRASPLVIKQLGAWYHPETPSPSHVMMLQLQIMVKPEMCFHQAAMLSLPHNRQLLLAVKNTLFSLLSEGFCFPSKCLVFSNISKLLMSPGSQNYCYLQGHKILLAYSGHLKQTLPLGARS